MSKLIFVKKLLHFEVRDFSRISYKKIQKSWNLEHFMQNLSGVAILVQFCWNLHQITLSYRLTICSAKFLIIWKLADLCFCTKKMAKMAIFAKFCYKNCYKSVNFQNIKNLALQIVSLYERVIWCKFQQNWTKIATSDRFCIKYPKFQDFCIFL